MAGPDAVPPEPVEPRSGLAAAHAELAQRQSFTDALLETIEIGIVSCDAAGVFVVSNRAERELFGLPGPLDGLPIHVIDHAIDVFTPDGRRLSPGEYPLTRALAGEDVSRVEVVAGPAGGPYHELVVRARRIVGTDGELLGAVAALTDVTAERAAVRALAEEHYRLAEAQRHVLHVARHDYLTELPNRALLVEHLQAALARATRDRRGIAVLFCDLDGFKAVNDTGGHAAGDAVLIEAARRLAGVVRDGDLVARVGGDEFVVVMEPQDRDEYAEDPVPEHLLEHGVVGTTGVPALSLPTTSQPSIQTIALDVAHRMTEALRRPITVDGVGYVVTVSIGIAHVTPADLTDGPGDGLRDAPVLVADTVLRRADSAMYRAKELGKNQVVDAASPADHHAGPPLPTRPWP